MTTDNREQKRNDIVDKAIAWWMYWRPANYNQDDHVKDCTVNLKYHKERELAKAIAELFK